MDGRLSWIEVSIDSVDSVTPMLFEKSEDCRADAETREHQIAMRLG